MKIFKKAKALAIVALLALSMGGAQLLADCSAQAQACSLSCEAFSPPGGSTQCVSQLDFASCVAFNADGSTYSSTWVQCPMIGC